MKPLAFRHQKDVCRQCRINDTRREAPIKQITTLNKVTNAHLSVAADKSYEKQS